MISAKTIKKKITNIICVLSLLGATVFQTGIETKADTFTSYDMIDSADSILTHGRTYYSDEGLVLPWTNSGFTFTFEGTGAEAQISTGAIYSGYEAFVNVYVDGSLIPTSTIRFSSAVGTYVLAQNLENKKHTVTVRRRSEVDNGKFSEIKISKINIEDGTLQVAPQPSERKIEIIGDSITAGFGNMVYDGSGAYTTATSEGTMTYAALTGKALEADTSILAKGGIAVSRAPSVPSFIDNYLQTANFTEQQTPWDFQGGSDVVVINLGTNDVGATDENGNVISQDYMMSEMEYFLRMVREKNPNAVIVWAYGIMGNWAQNAIRSAIASMNDDNIYYLPLENLNATTEGVGSYSHPTITTSINRSFQLTEFIAEKMGWDYDYRVQLQTQLWTLKEYDETTLGKYTQKSAENYLQVKEEVLQNCDTDNNEEIKNMIAKLQNAKNGLKVAQEGEGFKPNRDGVRVDISGFQISTTQEGFRTVYEIEDPNEAVESVGIIYGRGLSFSSKELELGSTNPQVYCFEATQNGKISPGMTQEEGKQYYAMTMKYGGMTENFFNEMIWVRAYAKKKDGTCFYSEKDCLTVQGVADYLYQNCLMKNKNRHEYLYYNILRKVNSFYQEKPFILEEENTY